MPEDRKQVIDGQDAFFHVLDMPVSQIIEYMYRVEKKNTHDCQHLQ